MSNRTSDSDVPRTRFLSKTVPRALTPRAKLRAERLTELERLLWIGQHGVLGPRGMLLNTYERNLPVSYLAMQLEIARNGKPPGLVEIAELIELGLKTWQPRIT
ncbi:hypothetical protein SAMN04488077_12716 [Roseovarius tolerans]|uniref:Uncharacterized protein n=1 Tax=Roseovarius tolerans TaxID=74031 RepID=A0A1H8J2B1_9RHOB|nr:hypothetical protein [Roseovarius tolerans]SEN75043.1 hypothetical protein SAMN04488077_12716 [Roseovarius tolerans]